jgi:hypothetical protein
MLRATRHAESTLRVQEWIRRAAHLQFVNAFPFFFFLHPTSIDPFATRDHDRCLYNIGISRATHAVEYALCAAAG